MPHILVPKTTTHNVYGVRQWQSAVSIAPTNQTQITLITTAHLWYHSEETGKAVFVFYLLSSLSRTALDMLACVCFLLTIFLMSHDRCNQVYGGLVCQWTCATGQTQSVSTSCACSGEWLVVVAFVVVVVIAALLLLVVSFVEVPLPLVLLDVNFVVNIFEDVVTVFIFLTIVLLQIHVTSSLTVASVSAPYAPQPKRDASGSIQTSAYVRMTPRITHMPCQLVWLKLSWQQ